ncbi:hypothetical protein F4777DRAFT_530811 [Nemania sp. FL0916]|nr:hypothetical protein F4777DRAFT_530811 [Nemania sp. FL0916]
MTMPGIIHNKVILIGFRSNISVPEHYRELFGTAEEIRAKLDADHARIQRAGITTVEVQLDPLDLEKGLLEFKAYLAKRDFDAVGIGAGVRLHPDYAALFENIVNVCRTTVPNVPLLFNDGPGGSAVTIERVFRVHIP